MLIDHYYRIRATWTTQAIKLFLDSLDSFRYQKRKCEIFTRPSSHTWELMPSLLPSKLDRIDNLLTRGHNPPNLMSVREGVAGSRDTRPDVSPARKQKNPWQRVLCEKLEEKPVLGVCFFYLGHFWLTSMFILTVRCTILWSWMICLFLPFGASIHKTAKRSRMQEGFVWNTVWLWHLMSRYSAQYWFFVRYRLLDHWRYPQIAAGQYVWFNISYAKILSCLLCNSQFKAKNMVEARLPALGSQERKPLVRY